VKKYIIAGLLLIMIFTTLNKSLAMDGKYYYVSNNGNDNNSGLKSNAPWKTLEKVNSFKFGPGDIICFKRGDVWRGQLVPRSGSKLGTIKYSSYGQSAEKPQIFGSIDKSKKSEWTQVSKSIWKTKVGDLDIGNIILDCKKCGVKVWRQQELKKESQFYYNVKTFELFIYSQKNPAIIYSSIECAVNKYIIDQSFKSYVIYDGLSLKYGAAHGIGGVSTHNIVVRNCDISYIGGGDIYKDERQVRYGNGIEFWGGASDNIVEKCNIWEVYDAGVTNQNSGQIRSQYNITYRNNKIWNCEYSFEYFNSPSESSTSNISFENNTCSNAGRGWGHIQRPDKAGRHISFYSNKASIKNVIIKNNTFKNAEQCMVLVGPQFSGVNNLIFKNNKYYQKYNKLFAAWGKDKYYTADFKRFVVYKNQDHGSTIKTIY
jgi:hypothetical protein